MPRRQILESRGVNLKGGVVHQDVEPAQLFRRSRDGLLAEGAIGDVARDEDAAAAFGFDLLLRKPGVFVFIQVTDRDIRTFAREQNGDSAADA